MPNITRISNSDRAWRAVKHAKQTFGRAMLKGITIQPSSMTLEADTVALPMRERTGADDLGAEGKGKIKTGLMDTPENDDPLKRRIFKAHRRWDPLRKLKQFFRMIFPRANDADIEKIKEMAERKKLETLLRSEAAAAIQRFHGVFRRMQLTEKPLSTKRGNTGRVRFDKIHYNPNSIYLHIGQFPYNTNLLDFVDQGVTTNLSEAVRRNVTARFTIANGVIYRIDRNSTAGLPDLVTFQECMKVMNASLPPLSFPIGRIANGRQEYANVDEGPHLLIGGETKGGKSNMLNVLIGAIAFRTTPRDVRMMMVDLKGNGIELSFWEALPHLLKSGDLPNAAEKYPTNGIAAFPDQALALLETAADIADERMMKYTKHGAKNIDQWNARHKIKRDFHLLILIDEWTIVTDYTPAKSRTLLKRLAAIARAAGIHVVAALQTADKTTFTQNMKTNFPMRIAFAFQDVTGSALMVGDSSAINLEPAGRAVFKHGTRKFMIQTPFISNNDIETIVKKSKGEISESEAVSFSTLMVTENNIIEWALIENDGNLRVTEAFKKFRGKIEKAALERMLKGMEGTIYTIGEYAYTVEPGYGTRGRRVVKVDDAMGSPPDDENSGQDTGQTEIDQDFTEEIEPDEDIETEETEEEEQ